MPLGGKTILQRVYEQCVKLKDATVFIATDSNKIEESSRIFTKNIILTSEAHQSGTDRIIEALEGFENYIVVNVQGDEPFINPLLIQKLFELLLDNSVEVVTACERINNSKELFDPDVVKLVKNTENYALYFSRSPIPYIIDKVQLKIDERLFFQQNSFFKHIGIYGYSKEFLDKFKFLNHNNLEILESLEQLRILENGYKIKVFETQYSSIGIDTKCDYDRALDYVKENNLYN